MKPDRVRQKPDQNAGLFAHMRWVIARERAVRMTREQIRRWRVRP